MIRTQRRAWHRHGYVRHVGVRASSHTSRGAVQYGWSGLDHRPTFARKGGGCV